MIEAKFKNTIGMPWVKFEPVRVGNIPVGLGTPNIYIVVEDNSKLICRIDVYGDSSEESFAFKEVLIWNKQVVVGFGHKVYFISLNNCNPITIELDSYFGYFYPLTDFLLVASGSRLFCVNKYGNIKWSSSELGIDGVIVDQIDHEFIYAQGEWDPPGGWRPFKVHLKSGKLV